MSDLVFDLPPAVVPIGSRWWRIIQVALSYLPWIAAALALLAGVLLAARLTRRRRRRLGYRAALTAWALCCLAGFAILVLPAGLRQPARPPSAGLHRPGPGTAWPTFMSGAARTGCLEGHTGPARGERLWAFREDLLRAPFAGSPAVVGGRVYVGSDNQRLYCFDAVTGDVLWTFKAACEIFASPAVADGRVYIGEGLHHHSDARVYCLNADTGDLIWSFPTTSHVEFSPTLFDGRLYVGAGDDGVYCLDAATGSKVWRHGGVHVDQSPAVTSEGVFFGNVYGEPAFFCLDPRSGSLRWRTPAPMGVTGSPSTDGSRVCFGLGNGTFGMSHAEPKGAVCCLDAKDGRVLWRTTDVRDTVLTSTALADGRAYFGGRDGRLYCVSAETGQARWTFDAGAPICSSPAVAGGRVYFGCDDGQVYALDALRGEPVWGYDTSRASFSTDARVMASPALAGGRLYVGSMNFYFFCLGDPSAEHAEKP